MFLLDMNTCQSYRTNVAFCSVWCSLSLSNRSFIFPPAGSEDKNSQSSDYKEVVRLCVKITNIFLHIK